MSRAVREIRPVVAEFDVRLPNRVAELWPVTAAMALAVAFILARLYAGPVGFLYEGALTLLTLFSYITAAAVMVTELLVKTESLRRFGLISLAAGVSFNFSGWMIRWIEAGDAEGWKKGINGIWRYVPLDNLYPLTLGFCFGAAITTLIIIRKEKYRFLGALSMPIVTVILTVAMLLGNDIKTLPPILDSYWRPIHVSVATIAYGVCLVSFGLAFAYLLKDGIRSEAVAIAVSLFGIIVYGAVSRFDVPVHAEYGVSVWLDKTLLPVRAELQGVGPLMAIGFAALIAAALLFGIDMWRRDEKARRWAWTIFRGTVVLQAIIIVLVFYQISHTANPKSAIPQREYAAFGDWLSKQMQSDVPVERQADLAQRWIEQNGAGFTLNPKSNPVELGGLIGLGVALFMTALFAAKRGKVVASLPSLDTIDGLLYKTVGVAFPLLSLLLITGAVWANESWGRYWGWDPKEVGALVAWMAYAAFLHTRIARGWRGRRSAYFALLGFALVIFTWLGVSYLLPGLHSYA